MLRSLFFVILLFWVSAVFAAPWMDGEVLDYEISWGFVAAGNARLEVQPMSGSPARTEFISHAWNNGVFESLYPVKDTVYTRVRNEGWLPEVFYKVLNEGNYHNKSRIAFDRAGGKAYLSDTVFRDPVKRTVKRSADTTLDITGEEHSILSAFYLVRTLDLQPGQTAQLQAVSGKKKYLLKVVFHRREKLETVLGKKDCLVIEPMLDGDGIFKAKGKLTIWLTDDEQRIPVLMKTEIALGSIKATLTGFRE